MARPRKKIDPDQVEKLAAINCSTAEIGSIVGCSADTLQRRFAAALEKGRNHGKSSLKRKMWDTAVNNGNVTMMIWLSKNMLGYSDRTVETRVTVADHITPEQADAETQEILARLQARKSAKPT